MRTQHSSKSGLFLMELIIAIVFFAIAGAICTRLFVAAHLTSTRSGDLATATSIAQNAAEAFKTGGGALIAAAESQSPGSTRGMPDEAGEVSPGSYLQTFYDAEGNELGPDGSAGALYRMTYLYKAENGINSAEFAVFKLSDIPGEFREPLITLTASQYVAEQAS